MYANYDFTSILPRKLKTIIPIPKPICATCNQSKPPLKVLNGSRLTNPLIENTNPYMYQNTFLIFCFFCSGTFISLSITMWMMPIMAKTTSKINKPFAIVL